MVRHATQTPASQRGSLLVVRVPSEDVGFVVTRSLNCGLIRDLLSVANANVNPTVENLNPLQIGLLASNAMSAKSA